MKSGDHTDPVLGATPGWWSNLYIKVSFPIAKHLWALAEAVWWNKKCLELRISAGQEGRAAPHTPQNPSGPGLALRGSHTSLLPWWHGWTTGSLTTPPAGAQEDSIQNWIQLHSIYVYIQFVLLLLSLLFCLVFKRHWQYFSEKQRAVCHLITHFLDSLKNCRPSWVAQKLPVSVYCISLGKSN